MVKTIKKIQKIKIKDPNSKSNIIMMSYFGKFTGSD